MISHRVHSVAIVFCFLVACMEAGKGREQDAEAFIFLKKYALSWI